MTHRGELEQLMRHLAALESLMVRAVQIGKVTWQRIEARWISITGQQVEILPVSQGTIFPCNA